MERLPPLRAAEAAGFMAAAERTAGENLRRREGCMIGETVRDVKNRGLEKEEEKGRGMR